MTEISATARRASNSTAMAGLARFGLAARAFVYLVIGWLAIQVARGHGGHEADQRGAIADIARHSYGIAVLWVLAVGFAAYAAWRLSEAAFGTAAQGKKIGPRIQSAVRGIIYLVFSISTFSFIVGRSHQKQSHQQEALTAQVMRHHYGRWLVGVIGLIVVVVGLSMVIKGLTGKFRKELRLSEMSHTTRSIVQRLAKIGTTARGIAFAGAGALVVDAAVTFDPHKSTGLDGALRTLANRAYGPYLLGILALGIIAFGIYGFAAARWAKT